MFSADVDFSRLEPGLIAWLRGKMPHAADLSMGDVQSSAAGFTNVSIPFTLRWREGKRHRSRGLLFRAAGTSFPVYPDAKLERQFRVMQCLQATPVPVPPVLWFEQDAGVLGFPFYLMGRVDGVVPSEYPPYHSLGVCYEAAPEKRARMWWGTLEAMARVHAVDWEGLGLSFLGVPERGTGPLDRELDYWERFLEWAREEPQPVLETALRWLKENRYAPSRITLCWGDARLPNTMFDADGTVLAVLDWDMAILGDPVSDLAFMITLDWLLSEGTGVPRLDGFPGKEETIRRYEELSGHVVEHFFYNEMFATLRAALVVLRVQKNLQKMGVELPGEDPILDNFCTRRLASLLGMKAMPRRTDTAESAKMSGTLQVHLTGPGGEDWHVVVDRGRAARKPGRAERPDATLTVSAEDWEAMRRGEINPFNAWTSGKLKVAGNHALYQHLANTLVRI